MKEECNTKLLDVRHPIVQNTRSRKRIAWGSAGASRRSGWNMVSRRVSRKRSTPSPRESSPRRSFRRTQSQTPSSTKTWNFEECLLRILLLKKGKLQKRCARQECSNIRNTYSKTTILENETAPTRAALSRWNDVIGRHPHAMVSSAGGAPRSTRNLQDAVLTRRKGVFRK